MLGVGIKTEPEDQNMRKLKLEYPENRTPKLYFG
jgi:hypothetical protein